MTTATAIKERIANLIEHANQIEALAADAIPPLLLARSLIEVDAAAASVARTLDALQTARPRA